MAFNSPLRYPGGKGRLTQWMSELLLHNNLSGGWYVEPYAGGAGMALNLLLGEHVNRILINDIDPAIHAFWKATLEHSEAIIDRLMTTPLTIEERDRQLGIYRQGKRSGLMDLGFATLYLNRTSVSGSLTGGVIGGRSQKGRYKMAARFNRENLARRLKSIAERPNRIGVYNMDAMEFVRVICKEIPDNTLIYYDPPYYQKGSALYRNSYEPSDHAKVAKIIQDCETPWVLTYDNCPEVQQLYTWANSTRFSLWYSATRKSARQQSEILFWSRNLSIHKAPYARR